jgi:hypothetical protein
LSFERKSELGECGALYPEGKPGFFSVIAVVRQQRAAMCDHRIEHRASGHELFAAHERDERMTAVQGLECFRNVFRYSYMVTRTNQCLRHALEKRDVGSNDEYRCHYSVSAPSASA